MGGIRFGTDGVRGRAFDELSEALAYEIGRAAALELQGDQAVIGRDTRESGPALRDALARGLADGGVEPLDLGVVPTPGVAFAAASRGAIGVMVSASHNAWHDNGIKLFTREGNKLSDGEQAGIEARLDAATDTESAQDARQSDTAVTLASAQTDVGDWVRSVAGSVGNRLDRLRVIVDAANGAASHVVAPALADLGAEVTVLFNRPDGRNINEGCGSTHPQALAAAVVDQGADVGIALDGDADRLLCVDHLGRVVDGDRLMALLATGLRARGRLTDDVVVVTVMSNLGFHRAMDSLGIRVEVTAVGDRHILEALSTNRWSFGGEQSGHLIFRDLATTGDGFLSAVQLLDLLADSDRPLAELADAAMTRFPQILENVRVADRVADPAADLAEEIAAAEAELGADGRVLIRASGTEPLIRVMVEAADEAMAERVCADLCDATTARFGG
ncbi:MAG: phosphoglucosamine mutase [Actinomycetota bacterium]